MTSDVLSAKLYAPLDRFTLDLSFSFQQHGITGIYGPSGCGKTTLLRCIAGLHAYQGECSFRGETWQSARALKQVHQRRIGYAYQEASLFPHLNVRQNLEYAWSRKQDSAPYCSLETLIDALGLEDLLTRKVDFLSGGQRQRVALARALAGQPVLLLMDEPLSALDEKAKKPILKFLQTLNRQHNLPMLYVSHALTEHASLCDRLLLMRDGQIEAEGPISDVLATPSVAKAQGEEAGVVLHATVREVDQKWHLIRAQFGQAELWLKWQGEQINQAIRIRLLARDISLSAEKQTSHSILNVLPVELESISPSLHPAMRLVKLNCDSQPLLARVTARSIETLDLFEGMQLWAQVKSAAVID